MRRLFSAASILLATWAGATAQQPPGAAKPPAAGAAVRPNVGATAAANFTRAQIVNINAQSGMLTLRTGAGAAAREQQFRMAKDARFFGPDRRLLQNGLSFDGFRPGTAVFFRTHAGDAAMINDLRLFDPSAPVLTGRVLSGQIVSVDAQSHTITIRTGTGASVRERKFRVAAETRFFGPDLLPLSEGLAFAGFRNGANVWFVGGSGDAAATLSGLSLADPAVATAEGGAAAEGGNVSADTRFMRGVIAMANAESGSLTLRLGEGANEREVNFSVTRDTKYYGADRRPLTGGLGFRGFRAGADVWFLTTSGDLTGAITDLRLYEPTAPPAAAPPAAGAAETPRPAPAGSDKAGSKFVRGRVVALDPEGRTITVKTGRGDDAREQEFKVVADAEFFGPERQPLPEGLKFEGLKPGVEVWLRVGTGDLANTVRDLRMYDPSAPDKDRGSVPDKDR